MSESEAAAVDGSPVCNTGVTRNRPPQVIDFIRARNQRIAVVFDYYRATIGTAEPRFVRELEVLLSERFGVKPVKDAPLYGFPGAWKFCDGRDPSKVLARLFFGDELAPCVQASGPSAHELWMMLREPFAGRIRASRLDVCIDANGVDVFEALDSALRELALVRGLVLDQRGDWDSPGSPRGRTRYVGSRTSVFFRRLYEYAKHHGSGASVRYELEVKPESEAKLAYGKLSPAEVLRCDDFSRRFLFGLGVAVDKLSVPRRVERPEVRPLLFLARQYGKTLSELLTTVYNSDKHALACAIFDEVERQARARHERGSGTG